MTEIFEECEREYSELFVNTSTKYITASSLPHGEKKKREILELQAALDDADVLIQKMDLEARSLQPSLKAILLAKLREYKTDQNKLKREVEELALHNSNVPAHEELLESGMAGANSARKIIGSCSNCVYDRMNSSISMEVLKRLPVKSLIRFKCVSKEWASLINHGDFFNLHREFSNSRIERFSFLIERGTNAKNQSSEIFLFNPEDESSQRWREGVIDDQANWFGAFHFLYDITRFPEIEELLFGHDYHRLKYVETFFEPKLIEGTDQYEAVLEKDKADTKEWEVARDEQNKINAESDQYEAVLEKDKASTKEWEVARDEQNKINAESDQYEAVLEKDKDATKEWEVARDEQNKINAEFDQREAVLEKDI